MKATTLILAMACAVGFSSCCCQTPGMHRNIAKDFCTAGNRHIIFQNRRIGAVLITNGDLLIDSAILANFFCGYNGCKPMLDIQAAADITAAIISITSTGGDVGCSPKTNVSRATPNPPITPSPIPPRRAPTMMQSRTINSCNNIAATY